MSYESRYWFSKEEVIKHELNQQIRRLEEQNLKLKELTKEASKWIKE